MLEVLNSNPDIILNGTKLRKEVLKYGTYRHPNPLFTDDPDYDWEFTPEDAEEMIRNFDAKLLDSVKVLDGHEEEAMKIVGNIVGLKKTHSGLTADVEFADEKLAERALTKLGDGRSAISGVSLGIDNGFRVSDGNNKQKRVKNVIRHLAIVPVPWIKGLQDWETVEESDAKMNFGHEDYTGIPVIHEGDEMVTKTRPKGKVDSSKKLDAVVKFLTDETGKEESAVRKMLSDAGIAEAEVDTKTDNDDTPEVKAAMTALKKFFDSDEEDEDEDEEDEEKVEAKIEKILKNKNKPIVDSLLALSDALEKGNKAVAEQKKAMREQAGKTAVKELIQAGRILPAQGDHYLELYMSDEDLFTKMTENLPQVVNFSDEADDSEAARFWGGSPYSKKLSDKDADEEVDRYLKLAQPISAGKTDTPSRDSRRD